MRIKYMFWPAIALSAIACSENTAEADQLYANVPLEVTVPANFPDMAYNIQNNPPTAKGFELGKKLFYDARLSSDGTISCGFCHIQQYAFTHHGHTVSHGVGEAVGTRNAPALQNLAYQPVFMFDGSVVHLDLQPIVPLTSVIEMNGNIASMLNMMKGDAAYRQLYQQAFTNGAIDSENMLKALSQFMVMLSSSNSRFDKFRRHESGAAFSEEESAGYAIFNSKCASCHATDLMTDHTFRNNGLAINPAVNDKGRYAVTEIESDAYKFKVPSLRNVQKTAPYMHDGRFGTLEAVLNHYNSGVVDSPTLDPVLKQNHTLGIALTATQKTQLIAFLKTLTDEQYLTDKRFSEF